MKGEVSIQFKKQNRDNGDLFLKNDWRDALSKFIHLNKKRTGTTGTLFN